MEKWAGVLFVVAAGAHGFLAPEHFAEWWGYGLFFIFASALQAVWGLALLTNAINPKDSGPRWRRLKTGFLVLGILGNVTTIVLYVVTRTVGIPLAGPQAGVVEEVAVVDIFTKVVEGATVFLLVAILLRLRASEPVAAGP
ncbi:MAG: hypothetical protein LC620_04495 [Halobacteriales archaeon]|nr:hypothetical protein [Halobacteriales archaeon]